MLAASLRFLREGEGEIKEVSPDFSGESLSEEFTVAAHLLILQSEKKLADTADLLLFFIDIAAAQPVYAAVISLKTLPDFVDFFLFHLRAPSDRRSASFGGAVKTEIPLSKASLHAG